MSNFYILKIELDNLAILPEHRHKGYEREMNGE